jgi:diacylglycerol kinase family enzyme
MMRCGNRLACEFGMNRRIPTLLRALDNEPKIVDVGEVNSEMFLMMVSIGLDAEVIHDLMMRRSGAISHLHYFKPILRQWWRWKPAPLRIEIDGAAADIKGPGMVVVANARQYAFRFDPAPHASMSDGLLDPVYFEVGARGGRAGLCGLGMALLAARARMRTHLKHRAVFHARAKHLRIECAQPQRFQVDGDPALERACDEGSTNRSACFTPLDIRIRPGVLRVFAP